MNSLLPRHICLQAIILTCLAAVLPTAAQQPGTVGSCPEARIELEQLPDLNIARAGHQVFCANGEYVVAGGHTNGFVPTPTAEYFKDGKWHVMQMVYSHDFGVSATLKSGKVLIAGGCEKASGIGQTYNAELYDPQAHTFRGFGILERKRVWASAMELDSGEVVIAGNWYHDDGIEMFHEAQSAKGDYLNKHSFTYIKDVSTQRTIPIILRIAKDDALIFGSNGIKGDTVRTAYAYRLNGDSLHIPLFDTWQPIRNRPSQNDAYFVGDEAKGNFVNLVPVRDSTGQVAVARFSGTEASLLPTACAIPMSCKGDSISYFAIIADRQAGRAYLFGISRKYPVLQDKARTYILSIDYAHASAKGAPIMLYYTDPLKITSDQAPVLTPEGNLLIAGGLTDGSNFSPTGKAYLIRFHGQAESSVAVWPWVLLAIAVLGALLLVLIIYRRTCTVPGKEVDAAKPETSNTMMSRINHLMEEQKLYRRNDLKVSDVAAELGTNTRYVSECIKSCTDSTFTQYVNVFRVEAAMRLMRNKPDMKITQVYSEVGFANENTFFRAFKSHTGLTPKEWISETRLFSKID